LRWLGDFDSNRRGGAVEEIKRILTSRGLQLTDSGERSTCQKDAVPTKSEFDRNWILEKRSLFGGFGISGNDVDAATGAVATEPEWRK
jgi:hypothetical protein